MDEEKKAYELIQSSPEALKQCDADFIGFGQRLETSVNAKYPFREMLIGESFTVPFGDMEMNSLANLRSLASQYSRTLMRRYKVIIHQTYNLVEVARIS